MQILLAVAFSLTAQFGGAPADPDLKWRTIETEHFHIHFPDILEEAAQKVGVRAEVVYEKRIRDFRWEPPSKVHIVLMDPSDSPNGIATPLPYNTIYLYGSPPIDDTPLDNYDDWLHTLIAHEFTHTVHLDMAKGINKVFRAIFGRFWLPNAPMQQWIHEGLSIFYETKDTTEGRGRSKFLEAYLRTVSLEDKFLGIDRATYFNDLYPYGNSAYWYGIGFLQFLEKHYGESKIIEFTHATASNPVLGFINFKSNDVFGKSLHRLWQEWRIEEKKKWEHYKKSQTSKLKSEKIFPKNSDEAYGIAGIPVWDEKNQFLYAPVKNKKDLSIQKFKMNESGKWVGEKIHAGTAARLSLAENFLLYATSKPVSKYQNVFDLKAFDLEKKKEVSLTFGLRLRDPIFYKGFVIAVRTDRFRSSIVRIPWDKIKLAVEKNEPLRNPADLEVLYEADGFSAISKPSGSPRKNEILFSMKRENRNRDLFILNLENRSLEQLTNDKVQDHHPIYSEDGASILYVGDNNIRRISRSSKKIEQVTDALTAANFPCAVKHGLFLGIFHSNGWELEFISGNSQTAAQPLDEKRASPLAPRQFETKISPTSSYRFGNALHPRYIIPLVLFTESDSLLGLQTGSRDPLGFHEWSLFGFQLLGPNRPGGSLAYSYSGWRPATFFMSGYAGILNYGRILIREDSVRRYVDPQDYYERSYGANAGFSSILTTRHGPSLFSWAVSGFYENRTSLFGFPSDTVRGMSADGVRLSPEEGNTLGGRLGLAFGPFLKLDTEYSPDGFGSDFHTLTTVISGKTSVDLFEDQKLAFRAVAGMQWLDALYQRPFLLGGSMGENPFSSINQRSYSLRGLPNSDLRGEGILLASAEYRFPLVKNLPGIGTLPLWFKNLNAAFFGDGGQTFQRQGITMLVENSPGREVENLGWDRYSLTAGAEIRSDASLFYAPPLTYRLGYGYVLYRQGEWLGNTRQHEIYFQAGASF